MATSHQIIPSPSQFTKLNQVFHTKLIPGREGSHVFYDYFVYLHGIFQNSSCLRNLRNLLKQHNLSYLLQIYELTLCYIAKLSPIFFFFFTHLPKVEQARQQGSKEPWGFSYDKLNMLCSFYCSSSKVNIFFTHKNENTSLHLVFLLRSC